MNVPHRRRTRNSLFCDSGTCRDRRGEAERAGETAGEREKDGEKGAGKSRENKCERKILNDQNSSHKALGLMLSLLLRAGKAPQLRQLPGMLHHENKLKPQREQSNSRRDLSSINSCFPPLLYSVLADCCCCVQCAALTLPCGLRDSSRKWKGIQVILHDNGATQRRCTYQIN